MLNPFRQSWLLHKFVRYLGLAIAAFSVTWLFALAGCSPKSATSQVHQSPTAPKVAEVRIGFQKGAPGLYVLKARGNLDKRFAEEGIKLSWVEFQSGPPMMEAMAANSVDLGNVGNLPPIFAQASDNPIVYVAATNSSAASQAIVVHADSAIKTLADLRGKKVSISKGTSTNYVILKALEKAGLTLNDIKPVYLNTPDGRTAFEGRSVDAFATFDPFYAKAERKNEIRVLTTATELTQLRNYYIATRDFAEKHPDVVKVILEELRVSEEWAQSNIPEVSKLLAKNTGFEPAVWQWALEKRPYFGVFDITDEFIKEQQDVTDLFYKEKLIPKAVQVKDAVWQP